VNLVGRLVRHDGGGVGTVEDSIQRIELRATLIAFTPRVSMMAGWLRRQSGSRAGSCLGWLLGMWGRIRPRSRNSELGIGISASSLGRGRRIKGDSLRFELQYSQSGVVFHPDSPSACFQTAPEP
jgi:hypothetical protein